MYPLSSLNVGLYGLSLLSASFASFNRKLGLKNFARFVSTDKSYNYTPLKHRSAFITSSMVTSNGMKPLNHCRRSARIRALTTKYSSNFLIEDSNNTSSSSASDTKYKHGSRRKTSTLKNISSKAKEKPKKKRVLSKTEALSKKARNKAKVDTLPRTREEAIRLDKPQILVMGIDEAGRGPIAGPVVAAAVYCSEDITGVTDSKTLTKEAEREILYEKICKSPYARWAIAVVDAKRIDDINILQATLEAMRNASRALVVRPNSQESGGQVIMDEASAGINGCYVVCQFNDANGIPISTTSKIDPGVKDEEFYALVDGNRVPQDMPCESEAIVKGDGKEFCIAAASILAKVTRDRIMHEYDVLYPKWLLSKHKGYPTALHFAKVREHGASPIHRRSFAPLKHMTFGKDGEVISDGNS